MLVSRLVKYGARRARSSGVNSSVTHEFYSAHGGTRKNTDKHGKSAMARNRIATATATRLKCRRIRWGRCRRRQSPARRPADAPGAAEADGDAVAVDNPRHTPRAFRVLQHSLQIGGALLHVEIL